MHATARRVHVFDRGPWKPDAVKCEKSNAHLSPLYICLYEIVYDFLSVYTFALLNFSPIS
jgi:hypothetical protein